jgi:hypothetical protein
MLSHRLIALLAAFAGAQAVVSAAGEAANRT